VTAPPGPAAVAARSRRPAAARGVDLLQVPVPRGAVGAAMAVLQAHGTPAEPYAARRAAAAAITAAGGGAPGDRARRHAQSVMWRVLLRHGCPAAAPAARLAADAVLALLLAEQGTAGQDRPAGGG
jgi:hypothetical protein